ncbi:MAG: hypothetical protein WDO73_10135 [Ignavibacteriota bacterium]
MTVALELLLTVVVVTLKVLEVVAAATVTDAGTVRVELVFVKVTLAPPAGAACVRVTVQVLDEFGPRLLGLQDNADTITAAVRFTVALAELLLYVAVTVALEFPLTVAVVALKVALVAAAATVTDAGTVRVELVFVKVTLAPPAGAACVSVTVQALEEFGPRVLGLHDSADTITAAVRFTVALAELLLYVAGNGRARIPTHGGRSCAEGRAGCGRGNRHRCRNGKGRIGIRQSDTGAARRSCLRERHGTGAGRVRTESARIT